MSERKRIVTQLQQGFDGDAWSGPPLMTVLDGVDVKVAAQRPIDGAHNIWEIVGHLIAGQAIMMDRIRGSATSNTDDEDWWPPLPEPTEENWTAALATLASQESELHDLIAAYPEDRLDEPLSTGGSSAYNNFHGHVQHNLYHAGQIVMLKKAAASN